MGMFTEALVRPPSRNFSKGLTTAGLGKPDYERALQQHEAYCVALQECGVTLTKLEADTLYPDSCFVEDPAIVLDARPRDGVIKSRRLLLTRPGAESRQGEIEGLRAALNELFPGQLVNEIKAPATLDGGDVCEAGNHFFIGLSERTNEAGVAQLAALLTRSGYTSTVVDIRSVNGLLHLKSAIAYLGDNRLVISGALAGREEFSGYDLIRVAPAEEYAANCVRVNDYVLVAAGYPRFEAQLGELGYQTILLEMTEFQKMEGGLSCLSLRF